MAQTKSPDHMVNDYKIGEGNMMGYLPAEFGKGVGNHLVEKSIKAGGDLIKGRVVEITGELEVSHTSASSAKVLGVAMFDAKKGGDISVEAEGLFKMVAASAIKAGDKVTSAADGKVATGTTNTIGIAITDAGTDEYVFVKFSI